VSAGKTRLPPAASLEALAARYQVFFVDQFGVLHDGTAPYPGAVEALVALKRAGRKIILLSNSGKRSAVNEERLVGLGFVRGSWDSFLTSGEVAWDLLSGDAPALKGRRCLHISRGDDRSAIDGLQLEIVDSGVEADLVLLTGSEGDRFSLDHYRAILAPAARSRAPCICTNPDKVMLTRSGPCFGAGRIAELYEELGGAVRWIGKPYPDIYEAALKKAGNPAPGSVICIGDSIEHDVAGGAMAHLATALVRSGILADLSDAELDLSFRRHKVKPDHILLRFAQRA
jgi:HAD superfamily hydrolase (TIGR01459 family)